jgi:hypothetical protein
MPRGAGVNEPGLVVVFTPDAARERWTVRATAADGGDVLPLATDGTVDGLSRPDVARLGEQMFEARAGCVVRTTADGAVEISATARSAVVLHGWLLEEIARAR